MACTGCPVRLPGECVYYSSTYLSSPNINNGDDFNTIVKKLTTLAAAGGIPNTKTDTNSIAITLSGTSNRNISAAVRRSSVSGNLLQEDTNGLYVVGSNLGASGARIYNGLVGNSATFRRIIGTAARIIVTENANDIQIDIDNAFAGGSSSLTGNLFS